MGVGKAICLKHTSAFMNERYKEFGLKFVDGQELSVEEVNQLPYTTSIVPIKVDDATQGNYEVVCENGNQIK